MFLDKFRNRYSFNFLAICGWIIFILFMIYTLPELYIQYIVGNTAHAIGVGFTFLGILILTIIFFILTFFVYVFEIGSWKRITNEKFLNNKYTQMAQILGIVFAFLPILILILCFILLFLQDKKVKAQFNQNDVPGIVFNENSSVAQAISKSQELNDFISKNATALKSGKDVTGSLGFTSDGNLHNAFGKVDILSAKLKGKYIDVILLDTYDFNPNERNWKVQMGYSAQKAGLLNPYYTIVKCKYKI